MPKRRAEISAAEFQATATEAEFQKAVRDVADRCGWLHVHFPSMLGNPSGWPDLILMKDGRTVFMELKRANGRLGPKQQEWITKLSAAGFLAGVFKPKDWPTIERVLCNEGGGRE